MNEAFKFLYHKYFANDKKWIPFMSVYYLTNSCNFRCPYCSDGSGKPYYQLPNHILPATDVLKIIGTIRKQCNSLVITGGEPLNHPEFGEVIKHVDSFRFKEIGVTTNGYNVDKYVEDLTQKLSSLVISLDTLDEAKADKNYGVGDGTFRKIMDNILLVEKYPKRKSKLFISSVLTPGNIADLYEVYEFSQQHGFTFAAAPHLQGVKANPLLLQDNQYYDFYNFLLAEKRKKRKIFGTALYLEYMRDLKKFECKPLTMLVVSPEGNVFYPCLEKGNYVDNLLENTNLNEILAKGKEKFGALPNCDTRCHSACALGFSLLIDYPLKNGVEMV